MSPSKFRKAIGAVKDQTSISLAKVGSSTSLADLDVAIVKATRHEEYPAEEKHIREILSLTCYSRAYVASCVNTISRRLSKTKNWVVALKSLILIQRLLQDGDPAYEQEIFFSTRRGTRLLNMSDFRDTSRSDSWDYSAFVRTYSLYLDEQLEYRMHGRRGSRRVISYDDDDDDDDDEEEEAPGPGALVVTTTPVHDMKNEKVFSRIQHLMQLLERFLACRPTGMAKSNRIVIVALYPIVKESFRLYYDITEALGVLIERFVEFDVADCMKVYEIFRRVAKQYDELDLFYEWSKSVGIARSSEYPDVDRISHKKLEVMDEYIRDKANSGHNLRLPSPEPQEEPVEEKEPEPEPEPEPEVDMNTIKALQPPEGFVEEKIEEVKEEKKKQDVGDLLNLGEDAPTTEEHADKLALALFDGCPVTTAPTDGTPAWEAFKDTGDWETALVQSASHLSNQKPALPGGFDTLLLDGMYKQGATQAVVANSGLIATGSASSVALGSAGRPAMLALPAPPKAEGGSAPAPGGDPFAASLSVAPPSYVQMSEMEKKQRLLVEEQMMWQQYQRDGMQGQVGLAKLQPNLYPHNNGVYTRLY